MWKNKLIFVETPDANETSIALENYRRVSPGIPSAIDITQSKGGYRLAIMAVVQSYFLWREAKFRKGLILTTTMAEL